MRFLKPIAENVFKVAAAVAIIAVIGAAGFALFSMEERISEKWLKGYFGPIVGFVIMAVATFALTVLAMAAGAAINEMRPSVRKARVQANEHEKKPDDENLDQPLVMFAFIAFLIVLLSAFVLWASGFGLFSIYLFIGVLDAIFLPWLGRRKKESEGGSLKETKDHLSSE